MNEARNPSLALRNQTIKYRYNTPQAESASSSSSASSYELINNGTEYNTSPIPNHLWLRYSTSHLLQKALPEKVPSSQPYPPLYISQIIKFIRFLRLPTERDLHESIRILGSDTVIPSLISHLKLYKSTSNLRTIPIPSNYDHPPAPSSEIIHPPSNARDNMHARPMHYCTCTPDFHFPHIALPISWHNKMHQVHTVLPYPKVE
jgi:hypothetical protein